MTTYKTLPDPLETNQHFVYGATAKRRIREVYSLARQCPNDIFIVPYRAITTNIPCVGNAEELAALFAEEYKVRPNLWFEESFAKLIEIELEKIDCHG